MVIFIGKCWFYGGPRGGAVRLLGADGSFLCPCRFWAILLLGGSVLLLAWTKIIRGLAETTGDAPRGGGRTSAFNLKNHLYFQAAAPCLGNICRNKI